MSEVIINRKWAEMIRDECAKQSDCGTCPWVKTCDDIWIEDSEIAPSLWNMEAMLYKD